MTKVLNRQVAKALRAKGRTVVVGVPPRTDKSNFWVIGDGGEAAVLNVQTFSILGMGCYGHPSYVATRDSLVQEAVDLLTTAGIAFTRSACPDQLFLNGYQPQQDAYRGGGR